MSSKFQNDAIFWIAVEKIKPNPYQPRRDFNEEALRNLAESIRQYGVLQPLTVTRKEETKDDGGLKVHYELIAGERRHRASQMANLSQVPVIIRSQQEDAQVKLELAIIENLQREDLNPIERAEAFDQLADEFEFTHKKIAEKIGKSREYVSNSMRLLKLPEEIKQAIIAGKMTEGHARPIMMLRDNPDKQETLFKEVVHKGLTVREAESIARRDAQDKVRKKKNKVDPETKALEEELSDTFGTRVKIEERDVGGKLVIDFFSDDDLESIIKLVRGDADVEMSDMMEKYISTTANSDQVDTTAPNQQPQMTQDQQTAATNTTKNSKEAASGSLAQTLGSMIASARKEAQENEANDEESVFSNQQSKDVPPSPDTAAQSQQAKKALGELNETQDSAQPNQSTNIEQGENSEDRQQFTVINENREVSEEKENLQSQNKRHAESNAAQHIKESVTNSADTVNVANNQKERSDVNQSSQRDFEENSNDESLSSRNSVPPESENDSVDSEELHTSTEEVEDRSGENEGPKTSSAIETDSIEQAQTEEQPENSQWHVNPSVPTNAKEEVSEDESDSAENDESETDRDESVEKQDDMYAISNFSI